tara:strand:+ start:4438 stop:5637 length:1200 start_codon:yes stop_codon:yes gene_type:complete
MSESSLPIDHAWSVVKGDPDKVEKILPLAVPAAFGLLGGFTGAGGRVFNPETGKLDPGFHGGATFQDPFTGGLLAEKEIEDATGGQRALGFATGALQGLNPLAYVSGAGRGAQAVRAGRQANRARAASRVGSDTAEAVARQQDMLYPGLRSKVTPEGYIDSTMTPFGAARQSAGRGFDAGATGLRRVGDSRFNRTLGRGFQALGQAEEQLGPVAATLMGAYGAQSLLGQDNDQDSGFGMQGQTQGFGSGGLGINDISNVQGNTVADRQIWNPDAYRSDPRATGFEAQQEFGGFGTTKGENMFVNNTGEEIRKQVEEMMYKAKCSECDKEDCIGKMHCSMNKAECPKCGKNCKCDDKKKADDKKSKKPAHGMVIVIGSKAGPGPSKDGKREKLDSEKKEE